MDLPRHVIRPKNTIRSSCKITRLSPRIGILCILLEWWITIALILIKIEQDRVWILSMDEYEYRYASIKKSEKKGATFDANCP